MKRYLRTGSGLLLAAAVLAPSPAGAADPVLCEFEAATIVGTDGPDVIVGTPARDVIVGLGGDDQISDVAGDHVCGGEGNDTVVSPGGLRAVGGPGNDRIEVVGGHVAQVVLLYGEDGDDVLVAGATHANLYGGDGDDTLLGGPADDDLEPGAGRDTVDGGDGFDVVRAERDLGPVYIDLTRGTSAGQGRDTIIGVEGASGTFGSDRLVGDHGPNSLGGQGGEGDLLSGREGEDTLVAYGGTLRGGGGDDSIIVECCVGGPRNDRFDGGEGHDWFFIDPFGFQLGPLRFDLEAGTLSGSTIGSDVASRFEAAEGTAYADVLLGNAADNQFDGRGGDDVVRGRAGNDTIEGGNGDDTLLGGAGDDLLDGGQDVDTLDGGDGADVCTDGESLTGCES